MSERWVEGTEMVKQDDGSYAEGQKKCFNMPNILILNQYTTSGGLVLTHIENEYIDVYLKEPVAHFLPGVQS